MFTLYRYLPDTLRLLSDIRVNVPYTLPDQAAKVDELLLVAVSSQTVTLTEVIQKSKRAASYTDV